MEQRLARIAARAHCESKAKAVRRPLPVVADRAAAELLEAARAFCAGEGNWA